MGKILISYFSASGVTKRKAEKLAQEVGGDLFEIVPKERYTNEDLDWMNENSRSSRKSRDKNCRPEIENININMDIYDTIFVGFPIWWGIAPSIVKTFLDQIDLTNKKIITFCTSGGSPLTPAIKDLQKTYPNATIE